MVTLDDLDPRNDPLRQKIKGPFAAAAKTLHRFTPVTANQITTGGLGLLIQGAYQAVEYNAGSSSDFTSWAGTAFTIVVGAGSDALDGQKAILENQELLYLIDSTKEIIEIEKANGRAYTYLELLVQQNEDILYERQLFGNVLDATADRIGNVGLAMSRAVMAHERGDVGGECAAYASGISASLPSSARAWQEYHKNLVEERGSNLFARIGTHPVRTAFGSFVTIFPTTDKLPFVGKYLPNLSIQAPVDLLTTAGNVYNFYDRMNRPWKTFDESKLSPEQIKILNKISDIAKVRLEYLEKMFVVSVAASIGTYTALRLKH